MGEVCSWLRADHRAAVRNGSNSDLHKHKWNRTFQLISGTIVPALSLKSLGRRGLTHGGWEGGESEGRRGLTHGGWEGGNSSSALL